MSRLIIKNLPAYITAARLQEHFEGRAPSSSKNTGPGGTITDVKVALQPDGTSRRFGFVGYKTEKEAGAARDWFNRSFIDSTRISVGIALAMDVDMTRDEDCLEKEEGISDLDWMKRRMTQAVDSAVAEKAFEQSDDDQIDQAGEAENEVDIEMASDPLPIAPEGTTVATILQTSRLFLRNLAFACTEAELRDLCEPFGEVSQVHIPLDPLTKASKGTAYITFTQPQCAVAAYRVLDRRSFQGRLLHVLAAVNRKGKIQIEEGDGRRKTVKEEKEGKRKAMAGREFNWGMLYMNSNAVASSIADRMNIAKSDILNPESSDNAAVKLALAETHVIQETKTYLESHGVDLSAFASSTSVRIPRSDTIILVKNIPYGTTVEQIRELFEPHGELIRVLVPPAGTMGVVQFVRSNDAGKAFRAVAYRRMGSAVVYLEKGPVGMFVAGGKRDRGTMESGVKPVVIDESEDGPEEPALSAGSTLFVKNLSFATTTKRLTQLFSGLPSFSFARVQTKPDTKRSGEADAPRLSMGYGFVGFKDVEGARRALGSMEGVVVDGHKLSVKFAGRGVDEMDTKGRATSKSRTTKMIVKNMPFEATKKDIQELFSAHGKLKSVRVPKKFNSRSRGFAFLEFITRHEAENAYAALKHTHLLGRHLVIEWAEEVEQDLDVLRQKAGVGFGDGGEMPGKKRKLEIGGGKGDIDHEDLS